MSRVWVATASALSLALALPVAAHAAVPPNCPDATLDTPPNTPLTLPFPNCTNVTGEYTIQLTSPPQHGTITPTAAGRNVYTPAAGFHDVDEFKYRITDPGNGQSNEATVTILVDTAPTCDDGTASTQVNQPLRLPGLPCDDADDPNEFIVWFDDGAHGTVDVDGGTGELVYTPDPGYVGEDSFAYYAEDDLGLISDERRMTITIKPAPVVVPVTPAPPPPPAPVVAAPRDLAAPSVSLRSAAKPLKQTLAKGLAIELTTNENASATLTLTLDKATARKLRLDRKAKAPVTVGTIRAALTPGKATIPIKLSAKARKALKAVKRVKLALTAVVTDTAGNTTTKTLVVTLKR